MSWFTSWPWLPEPQWTRTRGHSYCVLLETRASSHQSGRYLVQYWVHTLSHHKCGDTADSIQAWTIHWTLNPTSTTCYTSHTTKKLHSLSQLYLPHLKNGLSLRFTVRIKTWNMGRAAWCVAAAELFSLSGHLPDLTDR